MLKSPGGLGKYDLQSLVIDFYHDSGEIELNLATEIAQYGAAANMSSAYAMDDTEIIY